MLLAPQASLAQQTGDEINKQRFDILQKELEALKAGQKAIMDELQEIKKLVPPRGEARGEERSPIRDSNTVLSLGDNFSKGDKKAKGKAKAEAAPTAAHAPAGDDEDDE